MPEIRGDLELLEAFINRYEKAKRFST